MPCSCRCGHLCPQGFLWCNMYTTNLTHVLSSQSTHIAVSKVTKDHQCNAMGKTLSRNPCLCIIKRFWHHFMILLRNVCGLAPPLTGWDSLPAATDFSHETDIARIKYLRNTVYAHAEHASVDDATFDKHWKDIRDTLVRLGGVTYEVKDF